jgi:maltose 6'-phosphate phosphatase
MKIIPKQMIIFSVIFFLFVLACGADNDDPAGLPGPEAVAADAALLTDAAVIGNNISTNYIIQNLVSPFPLAGQNGTTITWIKVDVANGADIDLTTGVVTRGSLDTVITLTATISKDSAVAVKTFTLNIITLAAGYTINFYHPTLNPVNIHYSLAGSSWTTSPGQAMVNEGSGWWSRSVAQGIDLAFSFNDGTTWIPDGGLNFRTSVSNTYISNGVIYPYDPASGKPAKELIVLTINLHTYQETDALNKLNKVADLIAQIKPDFVCLQECAQHKTSLFTNDTKAPHQSGDDTLRQDNMAFVIAGRLLDTYGQTYNYYWSWAHYGWDVWEEGIAVMTPYTINNYGNSHLSTDLSRSSIHSRKAVYVNVTVPGIGSINAFSVHTSWWDTGLSTHIDYLKSYVNDRAAAHTPVGSIIGGDFNDDAGQDGYNKLVSTADGKFIDTYYLANPRGFDDTTKTAGSRVGDRIDYIFFKEGDPFTATTSQIFFANEYLGTVVSDHRGVITRIKVLD